MTREELEKIVAHHIDSAYQNGLNRYPTSNNEAIEDMMMYIYQHTQHLRERDKKRIFEVWRKARGFVFNYTVTERAIQLSEFNEWYNQNTEK